MPNTLTPEEQLIHDWKSGRMGGFMTKLMEAISHADQGNLVRLNLGFPLEVQAFIMYSQIEGWWQEVEWKVNN